MRSHRAYRSGKLGPSVWPFRRIACCRQCLQPFIDIEEACLTSYRTLQTFARRSASQVSPHRQRLSRFSNAELRIRKRTLAGLPLVSSNCYLTRGRWTFWPMGYFCSYYSLKIIYSIPIVIFAFAEAKLNIKKLAIIKFYFLLFLEITAGVILCSFSGR